MSVSMYINWGLFILVFLGIMFWKRELIKARIQEHLAWRKQLNDIKTLSYREEALKQAVIQGRARAQAYTPPTNNRLQQPIYQQPQEPQQQPQAPIYQQPQANPYAEIRAQIDAQIKADQKLMAKQNKPKKAKKIKLPKLNIQPQAPQQQPQDFKQLRKMMGVK